MTLEDNNLNQGFATGLAPENAPSLADLASPEEGAGAWPKGWYRSRVLPGYTTSRQKVLETKDALSKNADSRNLTLCLEVNGDVYVPSDTDPSKRKLTKGPGGTRQILVTLNYRSTDFTAETVARVKSARAQYAGVQGAWPDKSIQAISLTLGRFGQLEKALGKLPFDPTSGRFVPGAIVGAAFDVRLSIDEKGFSEAAAFAPSNSHVK